MFRKLVSNLPYSPALIADIGFYAKRLRSEEITRRTTILFVILALIMQSLAVFSPPESANASSEQDIIHGGVSNLDDFLTRYDRNEEDIKDIYTTTGVSRDEIAAAHPGTIHTSSDIYVMSRYGQLSGSSHELSMSYQRSSGGTGIRYFSPFITTTGSGADFSGWIGHSTALGWFGIVQSSGSLVTKGAPATINLSNAGATKTVAAVNLSQDSQPAHTTTAKPLDKINYTLKLSNPHSISVTASFDTRLTDLLEYATLIDTGGGTFSTSTNTLSWTDVQLAPGQSEERTFAVQLLSSFPATAMGKSNPTSYDCRITVVFGNEQTTPVDCPPVKGIESIFSYLPSVGMGANIAFGIVLLAVVVFFYVRTRQLKKEIRIIRHNFNAGIL